MLSLKCLNFSQFLLLKKNLKSVKNRSIIHIIAANLQSQQETKPITSSLAFYFICNIIFFITYYAVIAIICKVIFFIFNAVFLATCNRVFSTSCDVVILIPSNTVFLTTCNVPSPAICSFPPLGIFFFLSFMPDYP